MDESALQLINHLCTRIGMIMEDHAAIALSVGPLDQEGQRLAIADLARASASIAALIGAVQVLGG
jgi:hypothetical protein